MKEKNEVMVAEYEHPSYRTHWHHVTGYAYKHKVSQETISENEYKGVKWKNWKDENGILTATEVTSGMRLAYGNMSLQDLQQKVINLIDLYGIDWVYAMITRTVHGQQGVRVDIKDMFSYGIIK